MLLLVVPIRAAYHKVSLTNPPPLLLYGLDVQCIDVQLHRDQAVLSTGRRTPLRSC